MFLLGPNGSVMRITRFVDHFYKPHPLYPLYIEQYFAEFEFLKLVRMDKIYLLKWSDFTIHDPEIADRWIENLKSEGFKEVDSEHLEVKNALKQSREIIKDLVI
jgi:hypothetical protein